MGIATCPFNEGKVFFEELATKLAVESDDAMMAAELEDGTSGSNRVSEKVLFEHLIGDVRKTVNEKSAEVTWIRAGYLPICNGSQSTILVDTIHFGVINRDVVLG